MYNSLFPSSPWSMSAALMGGTALGGGYAGMNGLDGGTSALDMSSYVPQLWGYSQPTGATYANAQGGIASTLGSAAAPNALMQPAQSAQLYGSKPDAALGAGVASAFVSPNTPGGAPSPGQAPTPITNWPSTVQPSVAPVQAMSNLAR